MVSLRVVSEIAMVPDNECNTPTLISATAWLAAAHIMALAKTNFLISNSLSSFEGYLKSALLRGRTLREPN
jgi:hypothetical protein